MKRSVFVVALLALALFTVACATTPATPSLKGVITQIDGNAVTVTPAGGQPTVVNMNWATDVFWDNGAAAGRSILTVGHPVHVYLTDGTQTAKKIIIAN